MPEPNYGNVLFAVVRTSGDRQAGSTFSELINEEDWLPSEVNTQSVIDTLVNTLHEGSGKPAFTAVSLTSIPMEESMWNETESREQGTYARLCCDLTGESFWLPLHATVPAVAFRYEDENGNVEKWSEVVHPHLVAAGREKLSRALVEWVCRKVLETSSELEFALRRLQGLREQDTLQVE